MSAPFECILESFEAGHQSSRARIPGVPKIGVQNLLLHTASKVRANAAAMMVVGMA